MRERAITSGIVILATAWIGCAEVQVPEGKEMTVASAATGGVIGAGLGALIGNQTGNPGSGLVLGAVAGSSTGAIIGDALDTQNQEIKSRDETIQRQEEDINVQRRELDELRRMGDENVKFKDKGDVARSLNSSHVSENARLKSDLRQALDSDYNELPSRKPITLGDLKEPKLPTNTNGQIQEREISRLNSTGLHSNEDLGSSMAATLSPNDKKVVRGKYNWDGAAEEKVIKKSTATTPECADAQTEVDKALGINSIPDKLFHYRRALRLCPDSAAFHNGLGEVYLSLDRKADAEFEFKEALSLDPSFNDAQQNLELVR